MTLIVRSLRGWVLLWLWAMIMASSSSSSSSSSSTCSAFVTLPSQPPHIQGGSATTFVTTMRSTRMTPTPTFVFLATTTTATALSSSSSSSLSLSLSSGEGGGSGSGPAILDRPTRTIEKQKEVVDKADQKNAAASDAKANTPGWEIRLFNDPFNKREFVARCLAEVCGKSDTESFQIMMQAHKHGMGVVGRYMFEIAELYYSSLREQGLMVDMVPVDDE